MKQIIFLLLLLLSSCKEVKYEHFIANGNIRVKNDSTIGFSKYGNNLSDTFHIDALKYWDKNACEKVKTIGFVGFDTISLAFDQFTNVETIALSSQWNDIYISDVFPKLKKIEMEMALPTIDKNARFKKTLEHISAGKSTIKGIHSFSELPNLRSIDLGFSAFAPFPKDVGSLEYLEKFYLGAYNGYVDISDFELSKMKSLKSVILTSGYYDTLLIGFPKDIVKLNSDIKLEINHVLLTKEQKKLLKRFKKAEY